MEKKINPILTSHFSRNRDSKIVKAPRKDHEVNLGYYIGSIKTVKNYVGYPYKIKHYFIFSNPNLIPSSI